MKEIKKNKTVLFRINEKAFHIINEKCKKDNITVSKLIRNLLKEYCYENVKL
jgi:hypothetical protein